MTSLKATLGDVYYRVRYPRFRTLRKEAGGMLPPSVYARMYEEVRREPDLDVVEIGAAAGAGSIALYEAMRESGKSARLVIVERCEGGSRADFGDRDQNLARLRAHLSRFGATENVEIYPYELTWENGSDVLDLLTTRELAAFMHDADGHIDRDFALFWPRLRENGIIIIDDYDPHPHFTDISARRPEGGIKGVLTYRLLNQFMEWGLFERTAQVHDTVFGRKPAHADWARFDRERCAEIYAEVRRERADAMAQ